MALLDLLGRRAALRILWELSNADSQLTFRALQAAADTNPAVLNVRLKELRQARIIDHQEGGYSLSAQGCSLLQVFLPLHAWADVWKTDNVELDRQPVQRKT
jgi:DNA-binding HxlR family transcriptional regulator